MASVAESPAARHGTCRLQIVISGKLYSLRRMPCPPGFAEVWVLKRHEPDAAGNRPRYCVAAHADDPKPGCTCPDHRRNGCLCKHIMALRACGLIPAAAAREAEAPAPAPAAPPVAAPPPSFAAGFRQAVEDHLAARRPAASPAPAPSPALVESPANGRRLHAPRAREALAAARQAPAPSPRLVEEGWQPGGAARLPQPPECPPEFTPEGQAILARPRGRSKGVARSNGEARRLARSHS